MLHVLRVRSVLPWLLVSVTAIVAAACDLLGPSNGLTLSVVVKSVAPSASPSFRSPQDVIVGTGPNSIRITKVEFVLAELELSQAGTCSSPPAEDDDCNELELDPVLVDLPLDGTVQVVLDASVPPGTYTELEAELDAVGSDDDDDGEGGSAAFLAAHPDWPAGVSVRVVGVYTDAAGVAHDFTFTSGVSAGMELEFPNPITIDATTQNLTIAVDVASWFTNAAGAAIDPRNSESAELINHNIKESFNAFEDDDEDGEEDPD